MVDNDLGPDAGECIGLALSHNSTLKDLDISENTLKSEGGIYIIKNAKRLTRLNISKTGIKYEATHELGILLKNTTSLEKLLLDFNDIGVGGAKNVANGLLNNASIRYLSLKGDSIGDDGLIHLTRALKNNKIIIKIDISQNNITSKGFKDFCEEIKSSGLKIIIANKNPLGDDSLILLSEYIANSECKITRIEMGGCKLNDKGLLSLLSSIQNNKSLT